MFPTKNSPLDGQAPPAAVLQVGRLTASTIQRAGADTGVSVHYLRQAVGESLRNVEGILGLKGSSKRSKWLSCSGNISNGVHIEVDGDGKVSVKAKIILDATANPSDVLALAATAAACALRDIPQLTAERVDMKISGIMTPEEFSLKCAYGAPLPPGEDEAGEHN